MDGNRELAERFIASLEARDWDVWAGLLHPAVIYEIPQSRERIRGRDRYLRFNQEFPGDWHLRPKVTIADERRAVVWFEWLLDGRTDDAMVFFEFDDGLITRVTDFWPEPYEPPAGREHLVERWLTAAGQSPPVCGLPAMPRFVAVPFSGVYGLREALDKDCGQLPTRIGGVTVRNDPGRSLSRPESAVCPGSSPAGCPSQPHHATRRERTLFWNAYIRTLFCPGTQCGR